MEKHKLFEKPSSRIVLRYCSIAAIFIVVCALLIPTLLNKIIKKDTSYALGKCPLLLASWGDLH